MKRQTVSAIIFLFILLFFVFFILPQIDTGQVLASLKQTDYLLYAGALVMVTLGNVFYAIRWSALMKQAGARESQLLLHAFGMFSLGQSAGMIVPTRVGSYAKAPLVTKKDNISYETSISAVNAETILDLVYIVCAGIASLFILTVSLSAHEGRTLMLLLAGLVILGLAIFLVHGLHLDRRIHGSLLNMASDTNPVGIIRIPAYILKKMLDLVNSTKHFLSSWKLVPRLFLHTLAAQLFSVAGLFLVISSVSARVPFLVVFAILTVSVLAGILSMIPGGFGASDVSMIVLLAGAGISTPDATNIAILWRLAMYIPVLVVSGIYLVHQRGTGLMHKGV